MTNRMKKARKKYGLSCKDMSLILGLGINGWRNYESGKEIPNRSKTKLINIACTPDGMLDLLRMCPDITIKEIPKFNDCNNKVVRMVMGIEKKTEQFKNELNYKYFD